LTFGCSIKKRPVYSYFSGGISEAKNEGRIKVKNQKLELIMRRRSPLRGIAISIFVIILMFWNFSRIPGSDCVRAIHVVTLLACGAAIGALLMNVIMLIRNRSNNE